MGSDGKELKEKCDNRMASQSDKHCYCVKIGLMEYREAWDLQGKLLGARIDGSLDRDIILILEHPSVFTLGRRGGLDNIRVPKAFIEAQGIEVVHVERGGDITFHGPGQLVVYPVMDMRAGSWKVADFVEALEEIMIRTVADFGVIAERSSRNRGVWVGQDKLGSVGIAVRHEVSFHGFALNINISLEPFSWINPCGLEQVRMAAMKDLLGREIPMEDVHRSAMMHIREIFDLTLEKVDLAYILSHLENDILESVVS